MNKGRCLAYTEYLAPRGGDGREGILGCMPRDESVPLPKTLLFAAYLLCSLGSSQAFNCFAAFLDNGFLDCRDNLRYNEIGHPGLGSIVNL